MFRQAASRKPEGMSCWMVIQDMWLVSLSILTMVDASGSGGGGVVMVDNVGLWDRETGRQGDREGEESRVPGYQIPQYPHPCPF